MMSCVVLLIDTVAIIIRLVPGDNNICSDLQSQLRVVMLWLRADKC